MMSIIFRMGLVFGCLLGTMVCALAQTHNEYQISFPNAVHHEAVVSVTFSALDEGPLAVRMSRTSPGRYALHEFAKNVYRVTALNSQGEPLQIDRPDPYQWLISGHDGTIHLSYTLFANRGDGTYSQIDETHAHLNMPATFMYAPSLWQRPIKIQFNTANDPAWKIATQLKHLEGQTYYAPDLHYFMDSPTEISDFAIREWTQNSNGKDYNIRFVLHHRGTDAELDEYVAKVKPIVEQQQKVYGELPDFDYGTYTFLACYQDNVSGDGMEHRNSTILTDREGLGEGGMQGNIGTVSHEFFHAWNVERIRPHSLEPFDYEEVNMSGALWFAEGFTSYYTGLTLCRAGVITSEEYVNGLAGSLNYVWNSFGRMYFNPIEMSYQAPFVDAATSVDPVNRQNTFISYYSYGSVLGLALDLALRQKSDSRLTLDGYMRAVWQQYGKTEVPYTIRDLQQVLAEYADEAFAKDFFERYIFDAQRPDYEQLLNYVGVDFSLRNPDKVALGARVREIEGVWSLSTSPAQNSAAYLAGLESGDEIVSINNLTLSEDTDLNDILTTFQVGQSTPLQYRRYGKDRSTTIIWLPDATRHTRLWEQMEQKPSKKQLQARANWLEGK